MKRSTMLTITSLLSILLLIFHLADDILISGPRGLTNMTGVLVFIIYLVGTLLLSGRRSGLIIMLVGGAIALGMPALHFWYGIGKARGLVFVSGLLALGMLGAFAIILASLELRNFKRSE
jgi:hypothetical protein